MTSLAILGAIAALALTAALIVALIDMWNEHEQ